MSARPVTDKWPAGVRGHFPANTSLPARIGYVDGRMTNSAHTRWYTRMVDERPSEEDPCLPNGAGFAGVLMHFAADLRRVAVGMGFAPADADDILQDVRVQALASPQAYRGEEAAKHWLLRVMTNRCIAEFRRRRRFQRQAAQLIARQEAHAAAEGGPDADAIRAEELDRMRTCLATLDERLLAPIVLKYFHGLNSAQIGEVLELPAGTVRSRLHEGRLMLARSLIEGERQ